MDEKRLEEQLRRDGFAHTYVWQDRPGASYPDHTHPVETAHIILDGEMALTMKGDSRTYRAGKRCDVPAGAVHAAKVGPRGCRCLIGETWCAGARMDRMSHFLATLCALLFGVSLVAGPSLAQAETLSDVLQRMVPRAPLPPANVQLPITSYATLDDASYFAIGYYLASAADPNRLEPPLRVLAFDKRAGTWAHREFRSMETQTRGVNADCLGSVMTFQSVADWFLVTTHLTPSAGCTAILTRELVLKHTLYGWPAASFSSGRMIYERSEVHFASTHPLELALYDPATNAEHSLIPREDDGVWKDLVEDIHDTADLAWCRDHNASCNPETMDGSLKEIKVNNAAQACAFRVYYDAMGYGPKAEDFVGDATVVYIFDLSRGRLRHQEFRLDVLKERFGTVDLEKLIEPAGLQRVFGTPPN